MSEAPELGKRQRGIAEALETRSRKLAGVYRSALRLLESVAETGHEAARVSMICHCIREIMTGLPSALSIDDYPRPKPTSGALVQKLPGLLAHHPEVDLNLDQDMIPVPKEVAHTLAQLVTTATQEEGRNSANAAALVTGSQDRSHPVVKQWKDAYKFFVGWAHLDRNHEEGRELPGDDELLTQIRVVEDVIEVRTNAFFDNIKALEDLLAQINASSEGDES
jgi:hypothetical protein